MKKEDQPIAIKNASFDNIKEIAALITDLGKDKAATAQYLEHWFWNNPSNSFSFITCLYKERIEGIATTNNFYFDYHGDKMLVGMPQKVYTSENIRGQGMFSKMYWENEKDNLENKNVDFFLTFTNAMSTPIYLMKFGYKKLQSPIINFCISNPFLRVRNGITVKTTDKFDERIFHNIPAVNNGILKDKTYYRWRYESSPEKYIILEIKENKNLLGYAILKKQVKKKIPVFLLMDYLSTDPNNLFEIIQISRKFAGKKLSPGLMILENEKFSPFLKKIKLKIKIKDQFNFLGKTVSKKEEHKLKETLFNFMFGDLDFL